MGIDVGVCIAHQAFSQLGMDVVRMSAVDEFVWLAPRLI